MKVTIALPRLDLSGLSEEVRKEVLITMRGGVKLIENSYKRRIATGPKTGRIYLRRGVEHQASAPGEAPATDQGELIASISSDAEIVGDTIDGYVRSTSPHALPLETGTRKMAARPALVPAVEENRKRIEDMLRAALRTATARFARKRS